MEKQDLKWVYNSKDIDIVYNILFLNNIKSTLGGKLYLIYLAFDWEICIARRKFADECRTIPMMLGTVKSRIFLTLYYFLC